MSLFDRRSHLGCGFISTCLMGMVALPFSAFESRAAFSLSGVVTENTTSTYTVSPSTTTAAMTSSTSLGLATGTIDGRLELGDVYEPGYPDVPPLPGETTPRSPTIWVNWMTEDTAELEWTDNSDVEDGYVLEKKMSDGRYEVVASFGPVAEQVAPKLETVTDLAASGEHCYRMVAYNAEGEAPSHPACFTTAPSGSCSVEKMKEILAMPESDDWSERIVRIDCAFVLSPRKLITKQLHFAGDAVNGMTFDLNDALLMGGEGWVNYGSDMIKVYSVESVREDDDLYALSTYIRPENITIRNARIKGSIRVFGMAGNGQGDPDPNAETEAEKRLSNQLWKSARTLGHTERAQAAAPKGIVLEDLEIEGVTRIPLYVSPGVTELTLRDSHVTGRSNSVAIYLDAESARNTIRDNTIDTETMDHLTGIWDRPLVAIDGSAENLIVNNRFSNLRLGGIFLYRNCGEGGVIRHQPPEHNHIINNVFYYHEYDGANPAVYLSSRDRGFGSGTFGFCDEDDGYAHGSSASNRDFARHNVVMQNQIYHTGIYPPIQTKNPDLNSPNYVDFNTRVSDETVVRGRPAGCFVDPDEIGFLLDGESYDEMETSCSGVEYICVEGELVEAPFDDCLMPWPTVEDTTYSLTPIVTSVFWSFF